MIIAGVDEAGLGPLLGPLASGRVALEVPDGTDHAAPWRILEETTADAFRAGDDRCVVADSKKIRNTGGWTAFARTLGVFAALRDGADAPYPLRRLLDRLAVETHNSMPWYAPPPDDDSADEDAPEDVALRALHARTAEILSANGATVRETAVRLLFEDAFNHRILDGGNKSAAAMVETAAHLRALAEAFPDETLSVVVDKQGGRNRYHPFLCRAFPGATVRIVEEGATRSAYVAEYDDAPSGGAQGALFSAPGDATATRSAPMEIAFLPKADSRAFCAALASMAAKFAREQCMERLNRFFTGRIPDLAPTAGYPADAPRYIEAVLPVLDELGLHRNMLVRLR